MSEDVAFEGYTSNDLGAENSAHRRTPKNFVQGARPISKNSILDFGVDSGSRALSAREFAIQFDIAVIEFAHASLKRFV